MKSKLLAFVLCCIGFLFGCNSDDSINLPLEVFTAEWHVSNISGGLAGINDDYVQGTIIWSFTPDSGTLEVENNNNTDTIYDGLPSGTYEYSILDVDGELFMIIDNQEFGGIASTTNSLTIDQNQTSNGSGADGFILQFR
ncbi:hypothetical protein [Spongiimicrobium sp. 3-5]|uniref:hypothetical protein n=1 Tax=Spongiimicrobium sp. 3-5 TaxID=3332596 RepID=UPI00397EC9A6